MTTFRPVEPTGRIWQVTDLLPLEQAHKLVTCDWTALDWHVSSKQESWARRQINWDDPTAQQLASLIDQQLPKINQALGTDFASCHGHFWIDLPGFTVDMHTDGHVPNSMQLYWQVPGPEYGTGFYLYQQHNSLLYQFSSNPNSGYIMLNHPNSDGSQPLFWHGMFNPVPPGTIRVSSYWRFE